MAEAQLHHVKRDDLKIAFDVRRHRLVESQVLMFMQLISTGVPIPPIRVYLKDGQLYVWDGRHRLEAYARLDIDDVDVEQSEFANEREVVLASFSANLNASGVSLQPTLDDYRFFVRSLRSEGMEEGLIVIELTDMGLLKQFAEKTVKDSLKAQKDENIEAAAKLVDEGDISAVEAAAQFGVSPKDVLKRIHRKVYDLESWAQDVTHCTQPLKKIMEKQLPVLLRNNPSSRVEAVAILQRAIGELHHRHIISRSLSARPFGATLKSLNIRATNGLRRRKLLNLPAKLWAEFRWIRPRPKMLRCQLKLGDFSPKNKMA